MLIDGEWISSDSRDVFNSFSPFKEEPIGTYPLATWEDIDAGIEAGLKAFDGLLSAGSSAIADYLDRFASLIAVNVESLAETAHGETGLAVAPRLRDVELPRTIRQIQLAAEAARQRSWCMPTISTKENIASYLAPIPGPIAVFGPNNFPFAFNPLCGGDFAAAMATQHPVFAIANRGHPETTRRVAELAVDAIGEAGLPSGSVQMIFGTEIENGLRLVADPRLSATAYTGSRAAGLALKRAAEMSGNLIYLELSSVNPILVLPGALRERALGIAREIADSILLDSGQFCTSPGVIVVPESSSGDQFVDHLGSCIAGSPDMRLLDDGVRQRLEAAEAKWMAAGATLLARSEGRSDWCTHPNSIYEADVESFVRSGADLQTEAFGSVALIVRYRNTSDLLAIASSLDTSLTGCIYSSHRGDDDDDYDLVEGLIRRKVGRLLNDKVPTGVSVVEAMNHGGPYPVTAHAGFTSVGIPASLRRFGMLQCFDGVRAERLPTELQPNNPLEIQRFVDGVWTRA